MIILQQSRGHLSSGDQLALDLPFAATKSLAARIGPTPIFTRASTATFVGSNGLIQTAAANAPRFDHDPVTPFACKGLLIEDSRTNLSLYSGALVANTGWFISESTLSPSGTGPDGGTAYLFADTFGTTTHTLLNNGGTGNSNSTSVISGTTYTGSIFLKKTGNTDWVQITCGSTGFGASQYANFNIGNGTVGNFAGLASGTSPRIEAYSNGWYRVSITVTAITTTTTANIVVAFTNNSNVTTRVPSYTYTTSTPNQILASLCQFEAGSFATSYIPTTTASAVRSADVCSISSLSFYNVTEGTVVGQSAISTSSASTTPELIRFGSGNDKIQIGNTNATSQAVSPVITSGGVTTYNSTSGTATVGASRKIASAYKTDDAISAFNGALGTADTSVTIPSGITTCTLFADSTGTFASLKYYRRRLPNAKLQALTV